jgi:hypothetical protein
LEEAKGDFKSAVDCYERAIIRGASPTKISESLDQLTEKFEMLNLKCSEVPMSKRHVKVCLMPVTFLNHL